MKRTFSIGGREIGDGAPPYVIAEIGVNHDGDVERAVALVHAAAAAGANAVKFQWFSAEDLVATGAECAGYQQVVSRGDQQTLLRPLELAAGDFERAIAAAHVLPPPLRDAGYDLVAKHRYKIFGQVESCRVPTGDFRKRFIDYCPDSEEPADPISGKVA